ncbi:hypothetical protein PFICI_02489 [Pestalotiopsis fici W106-1]|uniref:glucan endo-1,3-beta-D-glucosidase n=1 Tax=Pestalotiopsis fici (strain W106-1 / CGMCC3.15140) TaxID=1229662 RepID=W3XEM2_PESFW|nr:uncharacterized protein PFICI_02489 [Pestalotiopsis fici W106-1]ETS84464.1 hypothetical protein PFICI_02489 [Pestalotiopsis fici W106-1]
MERERRYSFDSDPGERAPLDSSNHNHQSPPSSRRYNNRNSQSHYYQDEPPSIYRDTVNTSPTRAGAHSNSDFTRLREERRRSRLAEGAAVATGAGAGTGIALAAADSATGVPQPPPHRESLNRSDWTTGAAPTNITPGVDNFSETAAGGLAGIASTVAQQNARQSGLDAMRGNDGYDYGYGHQPYGQQDYNQSYQTSQPQNSPYGQGSYNNYDQHYNSSSAYGQQGYDEGGYDRAYDQGYQTSNQYSNGPSSSSSHMVPMAAAALPAGAITPRSHQSFASDPFNDSRYAYDQRLAPGLGHVDPHDIMDDGDDGLEYSRRNSSRGNVSGGAAAAGATGAAAAEAYAPVGGSLGGAKEQSEWMKKQSGSSKKWRWAIIIVVGLIIAGAVVGGVVGGILGNKNKSKSTTGESASEDTSKNGDLNINSSEIQALLNNDNLHKVFPGVDYTPLNTQYPDCLSNPPSQNNVTRDVAVLSQLTNIIRLYGTDCNQTEMVIHALRQLEMEDTMRIWLGVWQDGNQTTNDRQLSQMWDILETYNDTYFEGLIVANEILFREQMTETELGDLLDSVRTNVTSLGLDLKVATSDLGDSWTSSLAAKSDAIMSNIHPFFGGINENEAASWTWSFWQNHDSGFMKSDAADNIISEIGWPSEGGMDCSSDTVYDCPDMAVAGIDGLNTLLDGWVCDALTNGTNYFWFEMFDEPWKIQFDTEHQAWEDHWGLMDVNRNLKDGVKIPDCGGTEVAAIKKKKRKA